MNLIFDNIFSKEKELYQRILKEAVWLITYFNKSVYFTGNLHDEQMRIYNKHIYLASPGDTRWNSYYFCFYSILKTQAALKVNIISLINIFVSIKI